jgi:hypothetical protein
MRVSSPDDCQLFQRVLYRLQGVEKKYDLNAGDMEVYLVFQWVEPGVVSICHCGDSDLERVDVINDLGVLIDNRITFMDHIELIMSKSD